MCVLGYDVKFISYCKLQTQRLKATSLKDLSGQMIQTALHFRKSIWLPHRRREGKRRENSKISCHSQATHGWQCYLRVELVRMNGPSVDGYQAAERAGGRRGRCYQCNLGCTSFYLGRLVEQPDECCFSSLGQETLVPKWFWRHEKMIRSGHAEAQHWKYEEHNLDNVIEELLETNHYQVSVWCYKLAQILILMLEIQVCACVYLQ